MWCAYCFHSFLAQIKTSSLACEDFWFPSVISLTIYLHLRKFSSARLWGCGKQISISRKDCLLRRSTCSQHEARLSSYLNTVGQGGKKPITASLFRALRSQDLPHRWDITSHAFILLDSKQQCKRKGTEGAELHVSALWVAHSGFRGCSRFFPQARVA